MSGQNHFAPLLMARANSMLRGVFFHGSLLPQSPAAFASASLKLLVPMTSFPSRKSMTTLALLISRTR